MQPEYKRNSYFARLKAEDPEAFKALAARGGLTRAARHGRDAALSIARAAQQAKWLAEVNPNGDLPPEEVAIRMADRRRVQTMKMQEGRRRPLHERRIAKTRAQNRARAEAKIAAARKALAEAEAALAAAEQDSGAA